MPQGKYQLLDPLNEQQYKDLREDIAERGILQPVVVDEAGEVIDGHHRRQIAVELGIDYPTHEAAGLTETQKLDASVALNLMGRKQTSEQKRETIRRYLLRLPEMSNRHIARVVGATDKTVAKVRGELESRAEIPHVTERRGADGRTQSVASKTTPSKPAPPIEPRPDPKAKRTEELERQRAYTAKRQAEKKAVEQAEVEELRERHEAIGGRVQASRKPPMRVVAAQDRVKAAINDCVITLIRALDDPGLDVDMIRAEMALPADFRIEAQVKKLRKRLTEFGSKLTELKAAEKHSRMVRESPERE